MINYEHFPKAVSFYSNRGFQYIEVPWVVSTPISDITRPTWSNPHIVTKAGKEKTFIGSGEQGFLYLICKGQLPPGNYQTITPCMRNDPFDATHTKYFMKHELISWEPPGTHMEHRIGTSRMVGFAREFFGTLTRHDAESVNMDDGSIDLEIQGVEIGSYGVRLCPFATWTFGTGIAEPRFSTAVSMAKPKDTA